MYDITHPYSVIYYNGEQKIMIISHYQTSYSTGNKKRHLSFYNCLEYLVDLLLTDV